MFLNQLNDKNNNNWINQFNSIIIIKWINKVE